jgi:hypothetical protein
MRFLMLVRATPDASPADAGGLLAADRFAAPSEGIRVRCAGGSVAVSGVPVDPAKPPISGYWLVEAESKEAAVEWAKRVPLREGEVEVRPLFELEDFPVDPSEQAGGWRDKEEALRAAPAPARRLGSRRYMGLLKADANTEAGVLPDEKLLTAMGAFFEEGVRTGLILGGEGLQPSSKGARVRYAGSKRTVVDGPFAETKELIAGYAIVQAASRDEAVDWTKRFVLVDAPGRLNQECECDLREIVER